MNRVKELGRDKGSYQISAPPKYSNPEVGSTVEDITSTVMCLYFASSICTVNSGAREGRPGCPDLDVL